MSLKKKIISSLIIFFVFLFFYFLIKSNFNFFSVKYFKYFLVVFLLVFILSFLLTLSEKIQEIFLTCFFSIIFALYLIEISMPLYVDGLYNKYQNSKKKKELKKNLSDFKKIYPLGYPSWNAGFVKKNFSSNINEDIYIFSGIPNVTTYHCSETKDFFEPDQIYESDRYGFNNPDLVYNEKEIQIVLIGDSFVHGQCVNQDNGYAGNLRKLYKDNAIISIGWRGAGPFEELGMLTEYGLKLKPNYILWVYFEANDYIEIVREQKNPILKKYLDINFSQNLLERQKEIDQISKEKITNLIKLLELNWHERNVFLSYLTHRIKLWNLRWNFFYKKSHTPSKNEFQYKKFREVLHTAKERVEKNGSKFIFVYQPAKSRYEEKDINHDEYYNKSKIIEIVQNLSIPIIDIHEQFIKETSPLNLWHGHTNEKGYKKAAEYIFSNLALN